MFRRIRMKCSSCGLTGHSKRVCSIPITPAQLKMAKNTRSKTEIINTAKALIEMKKNSIQHNTTPAVLEISPLPISINVEFLKDKVKTYIDSRKDFYVESARNPYIEDEFSEFWLAKASNGEQIGKGSGGMDIKTGLNEGIDAMCVIMNSTGSNEKSLMQNFSTAGQNLDTLFTEGKDNDAIKLFTESYSAKIQKIKEERGLTDLYILAFVSTQKDIYAVCFRLHIDRIPSVCSAGFVAGTTKENKNIMTLNFIDPVHGNVRLYKSKKRLELRLKMDAINAPEAIKLYSL